MQLQVAAEADGHGAIPLTNLLAIPTVHELEFADNAPDTLAHERNFTILSPRRAELTTAAGD